MSPADIEVLEFDPEALGAVLRAALGLAEDTKKGSGSLTRIGRLPVDSGTSLPIVLGFPSATHPLTQADLPRLSLNEPLGLLITPTSRWVPELPPEWHGVALADLLAAGAANSLVVAEGVRSRLVGLCDQIPVEGRTSVAWRLPAGTEWKQVRIELISDAIIVVHVHSLSRRFEPADLGMRNHKNGEPTLAWGILMLLARNAGSLEYIEGKGGRKLASQKQQLSRHLREAFGIAGEPIGWNRRTRTYEAAFVIQDHRPLHS